MRRLRAAIHQRQRESGARQTTSARVTLREHEHLCCADARRPSKCVEMSDSQVAREVARQIEGRAFGTRHSNSADGDDFRGVNALIAHVYAWWRTAATPDHFDGCISWDPQCSVHRSCRAARYDPLRPDHSHAPMVR